MSTEQYDLDANTLEWVYKNNFFSKWQLPSSLSKLYRLLMYLVDKHNFTSQFNEQHLAFLWFRLCTAKRFSNMKNL